MDGYLLGKQCTPHNVSAVDCGWGYAKCAYVYVYVCAESFVSVFFVLVLACVRDVVCPCFFVCWCAWICTYVCVRG